MPPGSFVLRLCSTLTFVPYFSLDPATLCAASSLLAFRVLSVTSTREGAQNLRRLFDVPKIAASVREVAYSDTDVDERLIQKKRIK